MLAGRRCGFRYWIHLGRIAALLDAPVVGLGLDIAREAARRAARHWPKHAFAVADLWEEWPVKNAAADLVLSIFAPKNFAETARVLAPGGWLAIVYPGPNHLVELNLSLDEVERIVISMHKLLAADGAQRADREAAPQWSADRQT